MAHSQPIQTYGPAPRPQPTNTNIWPSATPTAKQYKHMAEPHAHSQPIQTYGPAPHNRNIWSHNSQAAVFCLRFWPILLFALVLSVISLLTLCKILARLHFLLQFLLQFPGVPPLHFFRTTLLMDREHRYANKLDLVPSLSVPFCESDGGRA